MRNAEVKKVGVRKSKTRVLTLEVVMRKLLNTVGQRIFP